MLFTVSDVVLLFGSVVIKEFSIFNLMPPNASVFKSLSGRMHWGRAVAGMEEVGTLPGVEFDCANV